MDAIGKTGRRLYFPPVPPLVTARSLKSDFSRATHPRVLKERMEEAWAKVGVRTVVRIERGYQLRLDHTNGIAK